MKGPLSAVVVLALGLSAVAQSPAPPASSAPASSPSSNAAASSAAAPSAASAPAPAKPADLAATLTDAETAIAAINTDLAGLQPAEKTSAGWKTGWLKKGSHKQSAQVTQAAETVGPHATALPEMIAEVRTAHGSVGSAFRLFNNLTTVCTELDALVEAMQHSGKKEDATHLAADYSSLQRVRANISAYVEQRAAIVDPKGDVPPPVTASAARKKDEPAPPKKTVAKAKKKKPAHKTVAAN